MSRGFANPLTELAEFEELQQSLKKKKGPVQVSGCLDSQKVHLMQETMADRPWKLVVTYDDARAKEIYDDFGCFRTMSGCIRRRICCFTARISTAT